MLFRLASTLHRRRTKEQDAVGDRVLGAARSARSTGCVEGRSARTRRSRSCRSPSDVAKAEGDLDARLARLRPARLTIEAITAAVRPSDRRRIAGSIPAADPARKCSMGKSPGGGGADRSDNEGRHRRDLSLRIAAVERRARRARGYGSQPTRQCARPVAGAKAIAEQI